METGTLASTMENLKYLLRTAFAFALLVISFQGIAQESIMYQDIVTRDWFKMGFGSYGRIGVGTTIENASLNGRRLNLNNMGSVGGRMEEQDYLEFGLAFHMLPEAWTKDSTEINVQMRFSVFSGDGSLFANSNTSSIGGLTFAIPELYAEGRDVFTKGLNIWIGARLYRGFDVHMADYFYFNDHSGQGFGVEYKTTRFHTNFVASTDTNATVPPYFYINIKSGTPSLELRRRTVYTLEQDFKTRSNHLLTAMGEFHRIGNPSEFVDSNDIVLSLPAESGWVLGVKYQIDNLKGFLPGSFNQLSVRYGHGIANGGDGGSTRTWETFGAADTVSLRFDGGHSWHIVDHFLLNLSENFSLNGYAVYNQSRGAAQTDDIAPTYLGREVFNRKQDFTIGFKAVNYITRVFHWQTELHYSQRKDGTQPWYRTVKLSLVPTIALRAQKSVWSRPHLRFIYSVARYNDFARDNLYSPVLELIGPESWAHYFGVRAEWWTW